MKEDTLYGHILKSLHVFQKFQRCGFDYIVNPTTGELHKVKGGTLSGSHNLAFADLKDFVGLSNLESTPVHLNFDGTPVPVYDLSTGEFLGEY